MDNGKRKRISLHQIFDIVIIVVSTAIILFSSVMIGKTITKKKAVEAELQKKEDMLLSNKNQLIFLEGLKADKAILEYAHAISEKYIPKESEETGIVDLIPEPLPNNRENSHAKRPFWNTLKGLVPFFQGKCVIGEISIPKSPFPHAPRWRKLVWPRRRRG
jgi:hypothetical protein